MTLAVKVYADDDPTNLLGTLTGAHSRRWRDVKNDTGEWSLAINRHHSSASLLASRRIVRFELDGTDVWAGIIKPRRQRTKGATMADENIAVSGPGVLALLADALVGPEVPVGERPAWENRAFNFANPDYDDSDWPLAIERKSMFNQAASPYPGAPAGWPSVAYPAFWIQPQADAGTPPQPVGASYYRSTFTIAEEGDYSFIFSTDDGVEWWLDGALVVQETQAFLWKETRRFDVFLSAGTHQLAAKHINIDRPTSPATNIASLILAVIKPGSGGDLQLGTLVHVTDDSWKVRAYPAVAPTMTPGHILDIVLTEVQADGYLPGVTWDFDADTDSDGNGWLYPVDLTVRVGTTVFDLVRTLLGTSIDVRMDADLTLHAYNRNAMGADLSGSVIFNSAACVTVDHDTDPPLATTVLARYGTGEYAWIDTFEDPPIAVALDLGTAPSADQAERAAWALLFDTATDHVKVTWEGRRDVAGVQPYTNYRPGDWVAVLDRAGTSVVRTRVDALTMWEDSPSQDGVVGGFQRHAAEGEQAAGAGVGVGS